MENNKQTELAACPFCGGEAEPDFGFKNHDTETYFYVVCLECGAEAIGYKTEAEAVAAWNNRSFCEDHESCCNTCNHKCGITLIERGNSNE